MPLLHHTDHPLVMGCSLDDLRRKLTNADSPLAPWWRHFLTLAREDPIWHAPYTVLAALVTGEADDRRLARQAFLRFVELKAEGDTSIDAQLHTHVTEAPLARWAIWYDWVADLGWFTPAEDAALRAAMLDHAYCFAMQQMQGRARSADNQFLSNSLCAAVVGYLFGVRRGANPLAQRMYGEGLQGLATVFRLLPPGGYSHEGSTYHSSVVMPLTALAGAFYESVTGVPVFTHGVAPTHCPLQSALEISLRMIGPAGILPGWDHYGFGPADVKSGLVMLARLQRDPRPLAIIRACNLWYRNTLPAWGHDDRLWTLVWWPEELDRALPTAFPAWMVPSIGGALQDDATKMRVMQYWDMCGGMAQSGRLQVDPNAVTIEAYGSPLLLDGHMAIPRELEPIPADTVIAYAGRRIFETIQEYHRATWGELPFEEALASGMAGNVGMSNALILDGEGWYVPLTPCEGHGEALHTIGPLQVIRGNATAYYTDRYDVTRVQRTSLLCSGRYAVISDLVQAATPHAVTWQAYLRHTVSADNNALTIDTAEQVHGDLLFARDGAIALQPIPGYPVQPESGSVRCRFTVPAASTVRLDTAIIPQRCLEPQADLTAGWQRAIGGHTSTVALDTTFLTDPGSAPETPRRYTRTFDGQPWCNGPGCFLEVAVGGLDLTLRVNGQPVLPVLQPQPQSHWRNAAMMPWLFEITDVIRLGANTVEIIAPYFHGESACGPVTLYAVHAPLPVALARTGEAGLRLSIGDATDELLVEHAGDLIAWAGGETDARYALRAADGAVAVAEATTLRLPEVEFHAGVRCNVAWTPAETILGPYGSDMPVTVAWAGGRLSVSSHGCVQVSYHGDAAHRLRLMLPAPTPVFLNGQPLGLNEGEVVLELPPAVPSAGVSETPEAVYALTAQAGDACGQLLCQALASDDWRVQLAAADVVGILRVVEAVPALLALFAEGEQELPYPPLRYWWRWSEMLRNPDAEEGIDTALPLPLGMKRWRVKRTVVTALGKIGDARAAAPLEAALTRCDDFFPVTAQLALALGRIGAPSSIPVLARHLDHAEVNTRKHARLSHQLLTGALTREAFESQIQDGG